MSKESHEATEQKPVQAPKESNFLLTAMITLLVLTGVGETGLLGYIGFGVYRNTLTELIPDAVSTSEPYSGPVSFAGPALLVQDGEVIWELDTDGITDGAAASADQSQNESEGGKRLSTLSVPVINYELASQENVEQPKAPQQQDNQPVTTPTPEAPKVTNQATQVNNQSSGQTTTQTQKPTTTQNQNSGTGNQSGAAVTISPNQTQTAKPNTNANQSGGTQSSSNGGDFSNGKVLATKASDNKGDPVYHTKYCSAAQKIEEPDKIWYSSAKAAEDAGRRICGICGK